MTTTATGLLTNRGLRPIRLKRNDMSTDHNVIAPDIALTDLFARIRMMTKVETSYEETPVSWAAASIAYRFINEIVANFGALPIVMPLDDGSLMAEWRRDARLLQIEWSPDGSADFGISTDGMLEVEGVANSGIAPFLVWLDSETNLQ